MHSIRQLRQFAFEAMNTSWYVQAISILIEFIQIGLVRCRTYLAIEN